jgi:hypothetical protein
LPFCRPGGKQLRTKSDNLVLPLQFSWKFVVQGAILEGNELTDSGVSIKFKGISIFLRLEAV